MGIEVTTCSIGGGEPFAALFYSNAGHFIGPTFEDEEEAEAFLQFIEAEPGDIRRMSHDEIVRHVADFRVQREAALNGEHESQGGKFALQAASISSSVSGFLIGWSGEGPLKFGWRDDALTFSTFAAADAMRLSSPVLKSARVVRL